MGPRPEGAHGDAQQGLPWQVLYEEALALKAYDVIFCLAWLFLFIVFRLYDIPAVIGEILTGAVT